MKMRNYWVSIALLITVVGCAVANDYYTHGSFPSPGSPATSAAMRAELDLITAGFDKLPTFSGNASKAVIINGSANALSTTTGTLTLAGNFAISGAYATTLTVTGATGVTLPTTGTLATLAGAESLSNKTIPAPVLSGSVTGTYTLAGTPTITAPAISNPTFSGGGTLAGSYVGAYTLAGTPTIQAPIINGSVTGTYTLSNPTLTGTVEASSASITDGNYYFPTLNNAILDGETSGTYTLGGTPTLLGPKIEGAATLNGGQLIFPAIQQASSNVNTLDDYEEGTWTPSVGGTATYVVQDGHYVKIGKIVHLSMYMHINLIGTGATSSIIGVPFPVSTAWNNPNAAATVGYFAGLSKSVVDLKALVNSSGSPNILLYNITAAGASLANNAVMGNGTVLIIQATYETTN